jgi:thioredoxin-dependent peroxiredoxin
MHRLLNRRFVTFLGLALLAGALALVAADTMPQVGQMAPGFTLSSQDGTNVSLKDFKGKWVVVYFYPKDKTPGCTIEAHNFQRDLAQYDKKKAVILGVSVDTAESHKEFCAEQSLTFKLLADTDKKVIAQYGSTREMKGSVIAARNTFLVDPQGKIAKVWTGVEPNKHSEEVLTALNQIAK